MNENNIHRLFHWHIFLKGHIITHEKISYNWTERTKYVDEYKTVG